MPTELSIVGSKGWSTSQWQVMSLPLIQQSVVLLTEMIEVRGHPVRDRDVMGREAARVLGINAVARRLA